VTSNSPLVAIRLSLASLERNLQLLTWDYLRINRKIRGTEGKEGRNVEEDYVEGGGYESEESKRNEVGGK
jgi:hypothetical protein